MPAFLHRLWFVHLILASCAISPAAADQGDRPGDYSHVIPVSVSGKQAVVQMPVPQAVYFAARSPGLRDLRLFDAAGTLMPFAIVEQMQPTREDRTTASVSIFPIRAAAGSKNASEGLEIRPGENGAVISVIPSSRHRGGDVLTSLVLDLRGKEQVSAPVTALALTLPSEMTSYSAQVSLDISDDLQEWEELTVASISWLVNSQGASVRKHRIAFPPRPFRFARLRWVEGTPIEFAGIIAEFVAQKETPVRWESVVLQPMSPSTGADLVYASPLALPVQSLGLELQGNNVVLPALIGQYRKLQGAGAGKPAVRLAPVANATFFQLTQNGRQRVSGDIDVPLMHASQWVVRPQSSVNVRPGLRLRWKPGIIVFVAGGRQPYTLAFGSEGARSEQVPISQVAPGFSTRELSMLEQAKVGVPMVQHDEASRVREADKVHSASRMRVFGLWALLLTGVAALGFMAWRLSQQMKEV